MKLQEYIAIHKVLGILTTAYYSYCLAGHVEARQIGQ